MAIVTLKGTEFHTNGNLPAVGSQAPDFHLAGDDLSNKSLADFKGKKKLLNIVPSLDTDVCAISSQKFNEYAKDKKDAIMLVVSADMPFAQKRFCTDKSITNIKALSMMRSRNFAEDYGVLMQDGPLQGITARAVVVIDENDKVVYTQLVTEITSEPDYDAALKYL